mgnify:FL=1
MKIHRVVQMLGATTSTGKLASDMYDLGHKDYYSEAEGRYIPISHMDFQHMVRSFVKLCEQEEMLDRSENMGRVKDMVSKKAYQVMWDNCEKLKEDVKKTDDIVEHNDKIYKKNLEELQEKYEQEIKYKEVWKKAYYDETNKLGKGYIFSEIPNDTDGQEFLDKLKKHFNRTSYKMRVRGQHIKPELKGTGATYWGQNLDESTHMRIYIEAKKGEVK